VQEEAQVVTTLEEGAHELPIQHLGVGQRQRPGQHGCSLHPSFVACNHLKHAGRISARNHPWG
jgi:hypothetical protein